MRIWKVMERICGVVWIQKLYLSPSVLYWKEQKQWQVSGQETVLLCFLKDCKALASEASQSISQGHQHSHFGQDPAKENIFSGYPSQWLWTCIAVWAEPLSFWSLSPPLVPSFPLWDRQPVRQHFHSIYLQDFHAALQGMPRGPAACRAVLSTAAPIQPLAKLR